MTVARITTRTTMPASVNTVVWVVLLPKKDCGVAVAELVGGLGENADARVEEALGVELALAEILLVDISKVAPEAALKVSLEAALEAVLEALEARDEGVGEARDGGVVLGLELDPLHEATISIPKDFIKGDASMPEDNGKRTTRFTHEVEEGADVMLGVSVGSAGLKDTEVMSGSREGAIVWSDVCGGRTPLGSDG